MKKWIKILPLFIVEMIAKKYASIDTLQDESTWYRISEANGLLNGAGIMMRRTNAIKKDIDFNSAAQGLMDYLSKNHNPHTICIVDCNSAELLEGIKSIGSFE